MFRNLIFTLLTAGALFFAPGLAWAHLPKPIKQAGTILAVDAGSHTILFKPGNGKTPFRIEWNKETEFVKDGVKCSFAEIKTNAPVLIYFKKVTIHLPLLKKVVWTTGPVVGKIRSPMLYPAPAEINSVPVDWAAKACLMVSSNCSRVNGFGRKFAPSVRCCALPTTSVL
jgi:hypothetical protein